ncbi:MAG: ROK family protein [Chloroflexi bacterium]|nr:ROK family protein [Chloroflexota bacterium]
MQQLSVGIDLGGTTICTGLARADGSLVEFQVWPTEAENGPHHVVARMIASVRAVLERAQVDLDEVSGVGIGAPGPLDARTGTVLCAPNLPGWRNLPLRSLIQDALGRPTWLENDGNVAALAEHRFGAGRGAQHMLYVTVSTGIGGGIIANGRLYTGARGTAGELGHQTLDVNGPRCNCGNVGCWEALASGTAIAREARAALDAGQDSLIRDLAAYEGEAVSARTVYLAALQDDPLARRILERASFFLGVGLVNLINLFNPEVLVIGGGLSKMGDLLLGPALELARTRAFQPNVQELRVHLAELGDRAGVLGAAALGMTAVADGVYAV